MNKSQPVCAVFDYTHFLGVSCTKKLNFSDIIASFAPVFGTVWQDTVKESQNHEQRLWELALASLSTRRSDEANLIALLQLAQSEGIEELTLVMPYALDGQQLVTIKQNIDVELHSREGDQILAVIPQAAEH